MADNDTFKFRDLVLTVSYDTMDGYEVLVEVDADEHAASVPVTLDNAAGGVVEWVL